MTLPRRVSLSALLVFVAATFLANTLFAQSQFDEHRAVQSERVQRALAQRKVAQEQRPEVRTGFWRGMKITYDWYPNGNGGGKAVYQGDILLENVQDSPSPNGVTPNSQGTGATQYLWPQMGGVYQIPYAIQQGSGDMTNLNDAIMDFNNIFAGQIQFVPYVSQPNWVNFYFDPNNNYGSCEATEGNAGGGGGNYTPPQMAGGAGGTIYPCTLATIEHEMGHIVGLWHEQSRPDRNTYVTLNYGAVIKGSITADFTQFFGEGQQYLNPFDYASVMEYPAYSFSRNGNPVMESIPAGIPLSNPNGFSAADIDGIRRLYGFAPTQVTVTSNPPGLQVIVDSQPPVTTPQTYTWALNSTHTLSVANGAQTLSSTGISYVYGRWNDSTAQTHTITVTPGNNMVSQPATSPAITVYQANFIQLVPYVNTVSPTGAGTVVASPAPLTYSGLTGQYYVIRQQITLTATPMMGQNFYNYFGTPPSSPDLPGGTGSNPKTVYLPDGNTTAVNLVTYFSSSPIYTVTTNPLGSNLYVYVDNTYWYSPVNYSLSYDSSWTPSSSHLLNIDSQEQPWSDNTRFEYSTWSDGMAQSHNITLPSSGGATYTANLTPQYYASGTTYPVIYSNEGTCAATINVTPSSPTGDGFYPAGTPLSITETPTGGFSLTGWLYDLSGTGSSQNLTVNDEVLAIADYDVNTTPLAITSLSPFGIQAGGGPFTLTINGTGFVKNTTWIYINGYYRAVATYVSPTQVTVPLTAADIATPGAFLVGVGNYPISGCGAYAQSSFFVLINPNPPVGVASLSVKSISFSTTAVGTSSAVKPIVLTNTGAGPLPISSITASGDFAQSNNCPSSLASKATCTVNVTFNPTVASAITGAVTFNDGSTPSPQLVKVTGTGELPLTFSPTSVTLPSVAVGSTSSATVTLTNKQTSAISLNPGFSADYSAGGGTCTSSLAASASCTIVVNFTPTYKGSIKGALTVATNGAFSPLIIGLTGTATGGPTVQLTISPASETFTSTGIGATAAAKIITVTNKSTGTITINSLTATGDYAVVGSGTTPCGGALAAAAKCTLSVTFTPSQTGSIKGAVAIASTGLGSPQIVGLTGTGALPVTLAPTSLTFSSQAVGTTSAPQTVTLTNSSGGTLSLSSIVASGEFTAAAAGGTPCGATVAAGATCTFTVTFTPNVKGSISGAATVNESAPQSPAVIKLTGTGS